MQRARSCLRSAHGSSHSPSRQLGYRTDPQNTYCNRFSAYWRVGADDCNNENRDEEWSADFAAWVWRRAGVRFVYGFGAEDINAGSVSSTAGAWRTTRGTPSGPLRAQPGDIAVYGLDADKSTAEHVAVVVGYSPGARGPDVVNGDGDRTGFSVVESGTDQYKADLTGNGGQLSGYVLRLTQPPQTAQV